VALTLASLTFMTAFGIANAATARVGFHVGRGDTPGARRAGLIAIALGASFMGTAGLTFQFIPELLASAFTPERSVVLAAAPLVVIAGVFATSDGVQAVSAGALRGAGDTRWPFWTNLASHWVIGFPVAWWLGMRLGLGPAGFWWGLTAGLSMVALTLFVRFLLMSRRPIARLDGGVARSDGA
jgi:MATE family multidrug resistance protein